MDFPSHQTGKENVSHIHSVLKYLFFDNEMITLPNVER